MKDYVLYRIFRSQDATLYIPIKVLISLEYLSVTFYEFRQRNYRFRYLLDNLRIIAEYVNVLIYTCKYMYNFIIHYTFHHTFIHVSTYTFIFTSMVIRYRGYAILERDAPLECAGTAYSPSRGFMSC